MIMKSLTFLVSATSLTSVLSLAVAVLPDTRDLPTIDGPETEALVPPELAAAKRALIWLEDIRDSSVRGDLEITRELIDGVEAAYGTCLRVARDAVARAEGSTP